MNSIHLWSANRVRPFFCADLLFLAAEGGFALWRYLDRTRFRYFTVVGSERYRFSSADSKLIGIDVALHDFSKEDQDRCIIECMLEKEQEYSFLRVFHKLACCVRERRIPYTSIWINVSTLKAWFWRQPGLIGIKDRIDQRELEESIRRDGSLRIKWKATSNAPDFLYDSGSAQVGNWLYVICGYTNLNVVSEWVYGLDMKNRRWHRLIATPRGMAHSHLGVSVENGRYIYVVSGQKGIQCSPAVRDSYVLDTKTLQWTSFPPLPVPRYAPIAEIVGGRLHIAGGSAEDRVTPADEHWSIGVKDGKALESEWSKEPPIPRGGPHRGSIVVDGQIYVLGGQEGDFKAIAGDAQFTCTRNTIEKFYSECFHYIPTEQKWERLADMPVTASHTDYSVQRWRDLILVNGGQVDKEDSGGFLLTLSDCIQAYDLKTGTWSDFGRLPYRLKTVVCGIWGDDLFVTTGQRDRSVSNPRPGKVVNHCWTADLSLLAENQKEESEKQSTTGFMAGKKVFLVSHSLSSTGAPLLLSRLGKHLRDNGAQVGATTLGYDDAPGDLFNECGIHTIQPDLSFWKAAQADLVLVNTCAANVKNWVCTYLERFPESAKKLIWCVHENKTTQLGESLDETSQVSAAVFDSQSAERAWRDHGLRLPKKTRIIHPFLRESIQQASERRKHPFTGVKLGARSTRYFSRSQIRRSLGVEEGAMLVTLVGTYCDYKGQDILTRRIGKMLLKDPRLPIRLLLVGFKDEAQRRTYLGKLDKYERLAVGRKRAVTVKRDLAAYYAASDVFVMNTQERGETFGMVTIEAMAFGLPVLGTDAGGTPDIIENGKTGYLFPVGEVGQSELEKRLYELQDDRAKIQQMGGAARRRVMECFTPERFFSQWETLIRDGVD